MLRSASSDGKAKRKPSVDSPHAGPTKRKSLQQSTLFPVRPVLSPQPPNQSRREEPAEGAAERGIVWKFCDPRGGSKRGSVPMARPMPESSQAGAQQKAQQVDKLLSLMKRGKQRRQQCADGAEASASPDRPKPALRSCWQPRSSKVCLCRLGSVYR